MTSRVIIVTGASRGIGLAVSKFLLQKPQSCNLVVVARSREPLESLQKESGAGRVEVLAGDLGDLSMGQKAVDLALSTWGRLDGVIINHGQVEPVQRVVDADMDAWRKSFDLNVFSYIAMVYISCTAVSRSTAHCFTTDQIINTRTTQVQGTHSGYIVGRCSQSDLHVGMLRRGEGSTEPRSNNSSERGTRHYHHVNPARSSRHGNAADDSKCPLCAHGAGRCRQVSENESGWADVETGAARERDGQVGARSATGNEWRVPKVS